MQVLHAPIVQQPLVDVGKIRIGTSNSQQRSLQKGHDRLGIDLDVRSDGGLPVSTDVDSAFIRST